MTSDARTHLRFRLNDALRRPDVYGQDEVAQHLLLEAMAAVDGNLPRWQAELDRMRQGRDHAPTGVRGAYAIALPPESLRGASVSVYAEIAHRCGWLELDRALSEVEFRQVADGVGEWCTTDRTLSETIAAFGRPSVWIGGTNPLFPKTLVYTTAEAIEPIICIHLWNTFRETPPGSGPEGVLAEPVVLAVRHQPGAFHFTPEGARRRPRRD